MKSLLIAMIIGLFMVGCAIPRALPPNTELPVQSNTLEHNDINVSISNVDFISSNTGYLCMEIYGSEDGTSYKLLKTTDSGIHWASVGKIDKLKSTSFLDAKIGYAALNNDSKQMSTNLVFVKTVDDGVSWQPVEFFQKMQILKISLVDSKTIFVSIANLDTKISIGYRTQEYRTTDGGINWAEIRLPVNDYVESWLSDFSWISAQQGYILSGGEQSAGSQLKTLFYTSNGGKTWVIKSSTGSLGSPVLKPIGNLSASGYCNGIKFFSNGVGYIGLHRGAIIKSIDDGINFSPISDYDETGSAPNFINSNEGFAIINNVLNHTINGGGKWAEVISVEKLKSYLSQ